MKPYTKKIIDSLTSENIKVNDSLVEAMDVAVSSFPDINNSSIYFKKDFEELKEMLSAKAIVETNLDEKYTKVVSEFFTLILFPYEVDVGVDEKSYIIEGDKVVEISAYKNETNITETDDIVVVKEIYSWSLENNNVKSNKELIIYVYIAGDR